MNATQIDAVNKFFEAMGIPVGPGSLPITGFTLEVNIEDAPKLTLRTIPYKDEHFQALAKLRDISPNVTVQWHDPRTPPQLQSRPGNMPVTTYNSPQDQPTLPFAEPVVDLNKE